MDVNIFVSVIRRKLSAAGKYDYDFLIYYSTLLLQYKWLVIDFICTSEYVQTFSNLY